MKFSTLSKSLQSRFSATLCAALALIGMSPIASGQNEPGVLSYVTKTNIAYYAEAALETADDYTKEQCKLDIYYPTNTTGFATLIWFHGGGLTGGSRDFPNLKNQGIALVSVGYRLSPKGKFPCFLDDATAATAWTLQNIGKFGGDSRKVFISGHSAGGYLAAMIGMDPRWLAKYELSNRSLAGIIPVSAQVTTHFHVKQLRGDTGQALRPLIDEYAPLYYASKDLPPICLIVGDRKIEWKSRVEENDLLAVSLRNLGHPHTEFYEVPGFDHGSIGSGGMGHVSQFIKKVVAGGESGSSTQPN